MMPGIICASGRFCAGPVLTGPVLLGLCAAPALAQLLPAGTLQAVPPGSPLPRVLPAAPPPVALPAVPPAPPIGAGTPNATVRIASVAVTGVTAYPPGLMASLTAGLAGPATPLGRIETARQAILGRYRADGYVLSTVAAAIDADGRLRFIVTEGRIAAVKLSRDIGPAGVQVLRFLNRLTEMAPIDAATLERYLLLAQDVPGITLHAVLQPSAEDPGALTLIADVHRAPLTGLLTTDNYASPYTGPIESLLVANLNSVTQYGEQTQISLYHTWPDSQTFGQASEEVFLGASGLKLRVYGGDGQAVPTGVLGAVDYFGITSVFGAVLTYPLLRGRTQTLDLVASLDGEDTSIRTFSGFAADSLRIARVGADYALSDIALGAARPAVNSATFRLSQGLPVFGASAPGGAALPRPGEQTDFTKFAGEISRTQTLFAPWQGAALSLVGLLTGQWSGEALPPAEQFYLGGLQFTRGYWSGEVSGDKAMAATAELQLDTSLDLSVLGLGDALPAQFYGFYDWGETWQNQAQSLQLRIASAGGGVRVSVTSAAEFDVLALDRLNRFPAGAGPGIAPLGAAGAYWRVLVRF
jgi:hemolysin activation/secretion protein